ncbi:MAG: FtsX-like permease family protein [Bacteroidota bacterium]
MLLTSLKLAIRHIAQNVSFTLINLIGLSVGLAAAFAVMLYVQFEVSYEGFHKKADRIARLSVTYATEDQTFILGTAPNKAAPFLKENFPEVEEAVRILPHNFGESASVSYSQENFIEDRLYWSDPSLFKILTVELVKGNPDEALANINAAVISESRARKYFGEEDPIGKVLKVDNRYELEVKGVFKDLPPETHLPMEMIASIETIPMGRPNKLSWGNASFYTFLLLPENTNLEALKDKIMGLVKQQIPAEDLFFTFDITPLLDVHLHSPGIADRGAEYGDMNQIWILISLAILLVLIACVNYMNLSTAKSQQRAREVGISKTMGATSGQLALQFYVETALFSLFGLLLSLLILYLAVPFFSDMVQKELSFGSLFSTSFVFGLVGIWLLITFIAGSYPALYLSSFKPLQAIRQQKSPKSSSSTIRKGLVVFQFGISCALIVCSMILYQQLNYIQNKQLGYSPEQVVAVRVMGVRPRSNIETIEKEFNQLSAVKGVAITQSFPGHSTSGRMLSHTYSQDEPADLSTCRAEGGVFEVLGVDMLAGRPMKDLAEGDTITELVLNASAVSFLGWTPEEALGQKVEANLGNSIIVGVCDDFHFTSLKQEIGNYGFHNKNTEWLQYLLVKLDASNLSANLAALQETFETISPTTVFEYTFLDDQVAQLYRNEQSLAKLVFSFATLAIIIACLGLFALAAYATELRTKEIGIRKVLGAPVSRIVSLLSKDFLILVLIGFGIAVPVAWWAMHNWLLDFSYRINIQWWVFALAGLMAALIAFLTVSTQSIKAAMANPIEALRSE